jgi:hypothetical protein
MKSLAVLALSNSVCFAADLSHGSPEAQGVRPRLS